MAAAGHRRRHSVLQRSSAKLQECVCVLVLVLDSSLQGTSFPGHRAQGTGLADAGPPSSEVAVACSSEVASCGTGRHWERRREGCLAALDAPLPLQAHGRSGVSKLSPVLQLQRPATHLVGRACRVSLCASQMCACILGQGSWFAGISWCFMCAANQKAAKPTRPPRPRAQEPYPRSHAAAVQTCHDPDPAHCLSVVDEAACFFFCSVLLLPPLLLLLLLPPPALADLKRFCWPAD